MVPVLFPSKVRPLSFNSFDSKTISKVNLVQLVSIKSRVFWLFLGLSVDLQSWAGSKERRYLHQLVPSTT